MGDAIWGTESNVYIADNTTIDLGVRPTYSDTNAGEQILFEMQFMSTQPNAKFVSATANTLTMTNLTSGFTGAGYEAVVVAGDGVGEHVPITGYNPKTGMITLAGPWPVTPDSTSVITLGMVFDGVVIYQNTLTGKGVTNTASVGIELWGGGLNVVADSNTISNVRFGVFDAALDSGGEVQPSYFNLFENNTVSNVQAAMVIDDDDTNGQIGMVGVILRNNQVNNASEEAFLLRDILDSGNQHFYMILENNTATNVPAGVTIGNIGTAATNLVLDNNSFSRGSAPGSGASAINVDQGLVLTQQGNTFTGFPKTFGGTFTPTVTTAVSSAGVLLNAPFVITPGSVTLLVAPGTSKSSTSSTTKSKTASSNKNAKVATLAPAVVLLSGESIFTNASFIESQVPSLLKDSKSANGTANASELAA